MQFDYVIVRVEQIQLDQSGKDGYKFVALLPPLEMYPKEVWCLMERTREGQFS